MEEQTRRGNLERSAAIQYGELPQLEAELKKLEAKQDGAAGGQRLLKEEVDEEDIAKIVSKWTGHPSGQDAGRRGSQAGRDGEGASASG